MWLSPRPLSRQITMALRTQLRSQVTTDNTVLLSDDSWRSLRAVSVSVQPQWVAHLHAKRAPRVVMIAVSQQQHIRPLAHARTRDIAGIPSTAQVPRPDEEANRVAIVGLPSLERTPPCIVEPVQADFPGVAARGQ